MANPKALEKPRVNTNPISHPRRALPSNVQLAIAQRHRVVLAAPPSQTRFTTQKNKLSSTRSAIGRRRQSPPSIRTQFQSNPGVGSPLAIHLQYAISGGMEV